MIQDILLDSDNDLVFENGDFKIGDSLYQEVKAILEHAPGAFKLNELLGINLSDEIDDDNSLNLKAEIKKHMKLDGKKVKYFEFVNDNISIDVERI